MEYISCVNSKMRKYNKKGKIAKTFILFYNFGTYCVDDDDLVDYVSDLCYDNDFYYDNEILEDLVVNFFSNQILNKYRDEAKEYCEN